MNLIEINGDYMKKTVSVFTAAALLAGLMFLFSSCGMKKDLKQAQEILQSTPFSDADVENFSRLSFENGNGSGDNILYNDEEGRHGYVVNSKHSSADETHHPIADALFCNMLGDDEEEVLTVEKDEKNNRTIVTLYAYCDAIATGETKMYNVSECRFSGIKNLGFKLVDGKPCLIEKKDDGTVEELGKITVNGPLLETEGNSIADAKSTGKEKCWTNKESRTQTVNGKEFKINYDFSLKLFDDELFPYFCCEEFEKMYGVKRKSFDETVDKISIVKAYGKEYINSLLVTQYYDVTIQKNEKTGEMEYVVNK